MVAPTIFHKAQDYFGLRLFQTFQVCPESYRRVRARPCGRFKVQCPSREFKVPSSKFKVILESVQIVQVVQSLRFVQSLAAVQSSRFKCSRKEQFDRNCQISGIERRRASPLLTLGFRGRQALRSVGANYMITSNHVHLFIHDTGLQRKRNLSESCNCPLVHATRFRTGRTVSCIPIARSTALRLFSSGFPFGDSVR